ncbi:MAG: (2Fe-2S)-binding protein [Proteobacteria bacterium]|nr:(2Fe-2S)-binding protein [Pseudomonadota bacterium]
MQDNRCSVSLTVNGQQLRRDVPSSMHLVDFLREELGLTGSHLGCEHGVCGACSLFVNGNLVRGCLVLAAQLQGAEVKTIEGLSDSGELDSLQRAFLKHNALQCGFCTPGMLATAYDLVKNNPKASREDIRDYISGNYCRCTGYQAIVDAIESVIIEQGVQQ